ncbi:class I SAM-dependent methyltransferase [Hyphobacterium sp. CCMP332]|nr:class I SAM-dependent methyltransferase [Hyphobacterium sp. CCMP332]
MGVFLFRAFSFLKFWLRAGNAHGLHSPFVFDLYTKAINKKICNEGFAKIETVRQRFRQNSREIDIVDKGAGSTLLKKRRKISEIVKHSISDEKKCELLFRLALYFKPKKILELGTSLGIATAYLNLGCPRADLKSIEGDPQLAQLAQSHLGTGIDIINSSFSEALPNILPEFDSDFIYIDGDHKADSLLNYVKLILDKSSDNSDEKIFVIDDIYWSADMNRGWKQLIKDSRFGISIDLFQIGLLFTRRKQPKQHFYLRL